MRQTLVLAATAAVALLGTTCSPSTGPIHPMTIGNVWNMSTSTLHGTAIATLDTVSTATITRTALQKASLSNGREVVEFRDDTTTHTRTPDTTISTTGYFYMAEVGDTIKSYTSLDDTTGTSTLMSNPAAGQTWTEGTTTATVVGQEDVTVTAGTYKGAWKVKLSVRHGGLAFDIYEWYARGTGMVKVYYDASYGGSERVFDEELTSATIK